MPSIQMLSQTNKTYDDEVNFYYNFPPDQLELYPKVNKIYRTTYCNLALWNLYFMMPNVPQPTNLQEDWGLGQIFVRQNGLNIAWTIDKDTGNYVAIVSFKEARYEATLWVGYTICGLFMVLSTGGLYILTKKKFTRIKLQND